MGMSKHPRALVWEWRLASGISTSPLVWLLAACCIVSLCATPSRAQSGCPVSCLDAACVAEGCLDVAARSANCGPVHGTPGYTSAAYDIPAG